MKKKIYYWTPSISKVGTIKTTLNSAIGLAKFQKDYEIKILNVFGEWSKYKVFLKRYNVEVEDLTFDYYNFLPKKGFFSVRSGCSSGRSNPQTKLSFKSTLVAFSILAWPTARNPWWLWLIFSWFFQSFGC